MFKTPLSNILPIVIVFCALCFSSCGLFQPLPLKPIHNSDSVQRIGRSDLSKFDGNYDIVSVDSKGVLLDYAFLYKDIFKLRDLPGKNIYINLSFIDDRHLKATLYVDEKKVKAKKIKGRIKDNYFQFHSNHYTSRWVVFIVYNKQTNRIALSTEDDLYLDTNAGGVGFLLIIPIPLSGSSMDTYNLKFKKRKL